jgi:predicted N-formylglutamate amidohydrolase
LTTDKPAAVAVHNKKGSSSLLIFVDHAGNLTPHTLGQLGAMEYEYLSIAWDIGVAEVSRV